MEWRVRPMTTPEQMYCYSQSQQIMVQCGCIGYLRADMDTNGEGFFSSWEDHAGYLKSEQFKEEFDELINDLRFGEENAWLKNRTALAAFCRNHPAARMESAEENYGLRVDAENFTYMMRLNPNRGVYNLYCYCYRRDWLDHHLKNAARGIRFIDSNYKEQFKIPDGGRIQITYPDGTIRTEQCRYIDEYHVEIGFGGCHLFHICEFAERMENSQAQVTPLDEMQEPQRKAKHKDRGNTR